VRGRFENFVVVGIGGSALGNIALHSALNHPFYNLLTADKRGNRPRLFVPDNVDPDLIAGLLYVIDAEKTLFNVITKSGDTAETMANFLIFRQALSERLGENYAEHIVATTDRSRGALRRIADQEGYQTFEVPEGVGGRFSVLSPVGLLSAAITGIDVRELLAGAAFADERCRVPDLWKNPAYLNAVLQYILYWRGHSISVMMPYSQHLRDVADWYRQLWAESLGKRNSMAGGIVNVGPTPVKALGTTDQHSQLQLYVEGPYDKVINFLTVEHYAEIVPIPNVAEAFPAIAYLGGHTLNELIASEQFATEQALTNNHRPNCKHVLPEVNAFTVGQLLYILEVQTAFSGELYQVNAFNQPGVEEGKVITYALMGRSGYEDRRDRYLKAAERNPRFVVA
jgi:glucose-6-phosphate isomerase